MSNHKPRKRFGQHFLNDESVVQKIVHAANPQPDDHWIEIGPGQGVLTQALLPQMKKLTAIELDRDLAATLSSTLGEPSNLDVIQIDALKVNFSTLTQTPKSLRVIGNLPYNISTPLLFHFLTYTPLIQDMVFMMQKEVIDRITASPGTKAYGKLTVMVQYLCEVEALFQVGKESFTPPPKVESAVCRIIPRNHLEPQIKDISLLRSITASAFNQRRKVIQNSLKQFLSQEDFNQLSIDPQLRAEQLSYQQYCAITQYIEGKHD